MVGGVLAGNGPSLRGPSLRGHILSLGHSLRTFTNQLRFNRRRFDHRTGTQDAETFRQAIEDNDEEFIDAPLHNDMTASRNGPSLRGPSLSLGHSLSTDSDEDAMSRGHILSLGHSLSTVTEWLRYNRCRLDHRTGTQDAETFRQAFEDNDKDAIDTPLYKDMTALHVASQHGDLGIVTWLLKKDANVNAKDCYGSTPLHDASHHGKNDVVRVLLGYEAEVDATNDFDATPLTNAIRSGHNFIATLLLEKGASINRKGQNEFTPLHEASYFRNEKVIEDLLKYGADITAKTIRDQTPLKLASLKGYDDIERTLQKAAKAAKMATWKENNESLQCTICLEKAKSTDKKIQCCIKCKDGNFHNHCIQYWHKKSGLDDCPLCRREGTIF